MFLVKFLSRSFASSGIIVLEVFEFSTKIPGIIETTKLQIVKNIKYFCSIRILS